jgi:hypothetical protein
VLGYLAASVAIAAAVDWLVLGKIAATLTKRGYTYRPTLRRSVLLACIVAWVIYVDLYRPAEGYSWVLLIALSIVAGLFFLVAYLDVREQPEGDMLRRYSEHE